MIQRDFAGVNRQDVWNAQSALQISKIIKESLNNIRKHSDAATAAIVCRECGGALAVSITDYGCGFDTERKNTDVHYGLRFMQERVEEIGGSLHIRSKAGEGTTVEFEIPLPAIFICGPQYNPAFFALLLLFQPDSFSHLPYIA